MKSQTPETTAPSPRLLRTADVAALLQMREQTLAVWRGRGIGPAYLKLNGAVRYRECDITKWLDAQAVTCGGNP